MVAFLKAESVRRNADAFTLVCVSWTCSRMTLELPLPDCLLDGELTYLHAV